MREVGLFLAENSPKANNTVFERFRAVLHEGAISKRCQYMIEVLFQVRKDRYKDNPSVPEGLDLVEEEEQITHRVTLDDQLQVQEGLSEYLCQRVLIWTMLIRRLVQGRPKVLGERGSIWRDQKGDSGRFGRRVWRVGKRLRVG